jgi:hypothetical protein
MGKVHIYWFHGKIQVLKTNYLSEEKVPPMSKSDQLISWSQLATSRAIAFNPIARCLEAISLILTFRAEWLSPGMMVPDEEQLIVARIIYIVRQISPQLASELEALLRESEQSTKGLAPRLKVAEFYKENIFGFKKGIFRKLQSLSKDRPSEGSSTQEKRAYVEKLIAVWCEVLELPEELLLRTNNGIRICLEPEDLQGIKDFIESCFQDFAEYSGQEYLNPWHRKLQAT